MTTDDINLAYKVRRALDENLEALPASTIDRLASARAQALARKKADAPAAARKARRWFDVDFRFSGAGLGGLGAAIPVLALVVGLGGLGGLYQYEKQERIAEMAELDAAVLADELPLTAYLDHGFNAYLESQQRRQ